MRVMEDTKLAEEIELAGFENVVIQRYFAEDELNIEEERQDLLKSASAEQVPDLNLFYALTPNDEEQQKALCDFLNVLPLVESTYVEEEADLPQVDGQAREPFFG